MAETVQENSAYGLFHIYAHELQRSKAKQQAFMPPLALKLLPTQSCISLCVLVQSAQYFAHASPTSSQPVNICNPGVLTSVL